MTFDTHSPAMITLSTNYEELASSMDSSYAKKLPAGTQEALLTNWGRSGHAAQTPQCVHKRFEAQARHTPNAIALSYLKQRVTYRELDERADQLADQLVEVGVGPDTIVAIYAERSIELVVALVAILKAGGAYLALDPQAPPARLRDQIADAQPLLMLTQAELSERLPTTHIPQLFLESKGDKAGKAVKRAPVHVSPENLAYVSYTSGTTGRPKGVCVTHAAVDRLVQATDWAHFSKNDVFLLLSPIAFDASTLELWAPLTNGGCLAIYPPGPSIPERVAETLRAEGVTTLWLTAGLFHQMVASQLGAFAGLRHVLAGGDALSPVHIRRLQQVHPHILFTNGYGPTENTTFTTCWTTKQPLKEGSSVPIGFPIDGTHVMILNSDLQPVPVGVIGELYTGGAGLARCYLNQPRETALRFIPATGGSDEGGRMYRTGDLARWREDGAIDFLGRADHQVKIQGYRVELTEIEAALTRHSMVQDAITVVQGDGVGGKRLIAYVIFADEAVHDAAMYIRMLKTALQDQLPRYMVPWAILPLSTFPLTSNGKVDRAALPAATRTPRSLDTDYTPPGTALETRIAEIWSRALGIEPLGIDDDFFESGGHSLMAAELIRELQQALDVNISARILYLQPTIAEFSATIEAMLKEKVYEALPSD